MDIITENINSLKTIISKSDTSDYDWDIIVPDFKPDVGKIITADATAQISNKDIMQDRAMISGNVKINILYIPSENQTVIKNVETTQTFNYVMELSGLRQNMSLNILTIPEKIDVSILNTRKLHIALRLSFLANASEKNKLSYVSEINCEDILYKTKEISTYKAISESENVINISEEIEVPMGKPSIDEILKIDMKINNKDIKAIHNKIVVKGEIEVVTVYNSEIDGDKIQFMTHEIPFAEIFDIDNIDENTICDAEFLIKNFTHILKEDNEGEKRVISLDMCIFIQNKTYEKIKVNSIVDAYSPRYELDIEKTNYVFDEIINQSNGQFNIKDIALFEDVSDIYKIISINTRSDILNAETKDDSINIKGNILCEILYISSDNMEINSATCNLPFENIIECQGARNDVICDLKVDIAKCNYNIVSANEIELRVNLEYTAIIKRDVCNELICNVSYDDTKEIKTDRAPLTVYFCTGKENLWDIAKKYKTTIDEIISVNSLEEEIEIINGMKLLIP